jgi:rare lipoprotein A
MNQKLISGLTATLLLTTAIGIPSSNHAEAAPAASQGSEADPSASRSTSPIANSANVVKMGEQQTNRSSQSEESIARIHSHEQSGRKAATLYVRNIPVLTFVGPERKTSDEVKMGEVQTDNKPAAKLKLGYAPVEIAPDSRQNSQNPSNRDPIARATAIAAQLNQLHRDGMDAKNITVTWKPKRHQSTEQYVIEANKRQIVAVDVATTLPNTTRNPEQDALQVANRLRRLIGNAAPLRQVRNKPNRNRQEISLGPIRLRTTGWASWYGPGFHGNMSASGEVFNQHAMTAAHRTLPFGTRVKVTNLDNGQSVVVRINDRGPFSGGRVIDLSAGAARVLGLIQSGTAPVRLEVFGSRQTASIDN